MNLTKWALEQKWIRTEQLIRFYPVFVLLGIKIKISKCKKHASISVPVRWYNTNNNGVLFGGLMLLASDPFPALLFELLLPNVKAWNTQHSIKYLRPAKSKVTATIEIQEEDLSYFSEKLKENRTAKKDFSYSFYDEKGREIARVTHSALLRTSG